MEVSLYRNGEVAGLIPRPLPPGEAGRWVFLKPAADGAVEATAPPPERANAATLLVQHQASLHHPAQPDRQLSAWLQQARELSVLDQLEETTANAKSGFDLVDTPEPGTFAIGLSALVLLLQRPGRQAATS